MAILSQRNGDRCITTTIGELTDRAGWNHPDDWGMLGSTEWQWSDEIRFTENRDGIWFGERQADDREWYLCFEEGFGFDNLPPLDGEYQRESRWDCSGVTITYMVSNRTEGFGDCGRVGAVDILQMYTEWLERALEPHFPGASITVGFYPLRRWDYDDEITINGVEGDDQREEIMGIISDVVNTFEYQGFIEVPSVEELQTAPYLYSLPSTLVQKIIAGEDPYDPKGDHRVILRAIQEYDPHEPMTEIARIRQRIAESNGELDYLWKVEMTQDTIGGVHAPMARAVIEGLNPRAIYDAWDYLQLLEAKRNLARRTRDEHHAEAVRLQSLLAAAEANMANDDRVIARYTASITKEIALHHRGESPQWDAYHAAVEEGKKTKREQAYHKVIATFEHLLEMDDPRVRRSTSGNPVFVADDGTTIAPPGMGLGAGVEYCPIGWYLAEFEKRDIRLVEREVVH